jgi:hypothetical protein
MCKANIGDLNYNFSLLNYVDRTQFSFWENTFQSHFLMLFDKGRKF